MSHALTLVVLLAAVAAGGAVAKRFSVPYPIVFLLGGLALAFVPNLSPLKLDPQLIFLIVLPPLLVNGGWTTDWFALKRDIRSISLLAIGLVLCTTVIVALIGHNVIGLSWPMAFALGAIVAPPDAVAPEVIFERFSVPRRIVAILTGEGLLNDATALILYRYAIAAAVAGMFSLRAASISFFFVTIGGVAVGLLCAALIEGVLRFLRREDLNDSLLVQVVLLMAPYASYLPAEALGFSGVLAAVATGIYASRRSSEFMDPESRVAGAAVWELMTFLLNAFVFLLIGLQLRPIFSSLQQPLKTFLFDSGIVCITLIGVRFAWVFSSYAFWRRFAFVRRYEDPIDWRQRVLIAYSGMRGIVSLAAALAIPYTAASGAPLRGRAEIIAITIVVILVTLVGQGLTLSRLIQWLDVSEISNRQGQNAKVRIQALEAGLARLHQLEPTFNSAVEWEMAGRLLREYEERIEHLRGHLRGDSDEGEPPESSVDHQLQNEALQAERREIRRLRAAGEIPDDVYRGIEYDLDLADLRLT
jgi:CPA1 family monovalent cation:H+ antiporter